MKKICSTVTLVISLFISPLLSPIAAGAEPPTLIAAVRAGDTVKVKELLRTPGQTTVRDVRGSTALHWAALANDSKLVALLIAAGCDAHATNAAGATPLHYGTGNEQIVRDLLVAGADPNAKSVAGATPLHTAASRPQSQGSVRRLLEAGADVDAKRPSLFNVDVTPLWLATCFGEVGSVTQLLDYGATTGGTTAASPVAAAVFTGKLELVEEFVRRGGSVNYDDQFTGHGLNHLFYAGHRQLLPFMIEHGTSLQTSSSAGERVPPIVFAAYTETADITGVTALLANGADTNATTSGGHTALDWALRRGETPLVAFLRSRGAVNGPTSGRTKVIPENAIPSDAVGRASTLRDAVQRAVKILQRSSDGFLANGFVRKSDCVSCHQQSLPAIAYSRARQREFLVDESSLARQLHAQHSSWTKTLDASYELFEPQRDAPTDLGYGLVGLKSLGYSPDELTEATVWYLASSQLENGAFFSYDRRPPLEEGQIVGTTWAVGALRSFPQPIKTLDLDRSFAKAKAWLLVAEPQDPNQQLHQLLGLGWAGAQSSELKTIVDKVLSVQRPDGGWGSLPELPSDAWATGMTLFVLHEVGSVAAKDEHYRRGVDFLLRTQFANGSWRVPSRTWPVLPHFDSGFPHGKDQWISAAGTAWAAIALLNEIEPTAEQKDIPKAQLLMAKYPANSPPLRGSGDPGKSATATAVDGVFTRDILPIFRKSCAACHMGDKPQGDFKLDSVVGLLMGGQSGEPAVVPGKPEASPLIRYVTDQLQDLEMPPLAERSKYPALTKDEVEKLTAWIGQESNWHQGKSVPASK